MVASTMIAVLLIHSSEFRVEQKVDWGAKAVSLKELESRSRFMPRVLVQNGKTPISFVECRIMWIPALEAFGSLSKRQVVSMKYQVDGRDVYFVQWPTSVDSSASRDFSAIRGYGFIQLPTEKEYPFEYYREDQEISFAWITSFDVSSWFNNSSASVPFVRVELSKYLKS